MNSVSSSCETTYLDSLEWADIAGELGEENATNGPLAGAIDLGQTTAARIGNSYDLADSSLKWLLHDASGRPVAVAKLASSADPESVRRSNDTARSISRALAPEPARHVLLPLVEGRVRGRSLAVYPVLHPLSDSRAGWILERVKVGPRALRWLVTLAQATDAPADADYVQRMHIEPLRSVAEDDALMTGFGPIARQALERIESGKHIVRTVAMHGDAWKNNVMVDRQNTLGFETNRPGSRFVFIDWDTARADGYPFTDLIRVASVFKVVKGHVDRAVVAMAEAHGVTKTDVAGYIAASLGYTRLHPNFCKPEAIKASADAYLQDLRRYALVADDVSADA